jgi:hypothetical protein
MTVYLGRVDTPERKTTYPVFRDILFEGNRFVRCTGGSFFISSARGVTIRGNVLGFKGSAGRGDARDRSRVFVSYASDVRVVDNTWEKSPDVPAPGALVDLRQAEEIVWAGNRLATPGAAR